MNIETTSIDGVRRITSEKRSDPRGYLIRSFCEEHFAAAGLNTRWRQCSVTYSAAAGTLRGMHFQRTPFTEIKLIRCLTGMVWDCLVDIRKGSPSYGAWEAFELSEENGTSLYVPEDVAHGFLTLTPDVRLHYSMSEAYSAEHASGVRWDDPALGIAWPARPEIISEKDAALPLLREI